MSRTTISRLGWLTALLFALTLLAAACGSSADETTSSGDSAEEASFEEAEAADEGGFDVVADDEAMAEEAEAMEDDAEAPAAGQSSNLDRTDDGTDTAQDDGDGDSELGSSGASPTQLTAADFGRKIIFTADITVEVDDVAAAGKQATDIIADVGGFVFGQQTQGGSRPESVLIFKVLPEDFDRAVEALGNVGELRNQVISADDVTERVVDLETRIEVAELGVNRLRATLETTQDLEDYAELERLLLERESDLELMRGQLRTLQDRIDLATITLRLVQDVINHSLALGTTIYHAQDGGASCPGNDGGTVESGTELTVCFEIINTGEEPVADIAFIDTALGIDSAQDLTVVYGELDRLEGGQSLMLAHEMTADRRTQLRPKVTARPITEEGEPAGPSVDARGEGFIDVFEPESDPGFGEGFGAGVSVLKGIWTVVKVVIGFAIPMLVLLAIFGPLLWLGRRWWKGRPTKPGSTGPGPLPQPPPPKAASVSPEPAAATNAGGGNSPPAQS